MQAAGFVSYEEKPTRAPSVPSHVLAEHKMTIDPDRKPDSSTPVPVQSRVVFAGAGLGGLPSIGGSGGNAPTGI